jgi:glyoxylase-like metal-dependent hydrolase (beta-lactamase superfamily II)
MPKLGKFSLEPVGDGFFRLDGGAIFGIVPRVLWEKTNPPDENNRILLGINPVLIRTGDENILVDTGIGGKGDGKFNSIYAIEKKPSLHESLALLGLKEEDISIVINTHLHLDHAGGNTFKEENGSIRPTFPNARYFVQKGEWEDANHPNERTKRSYNPEDFLPVMEAGQMELIDGEREIVEGVSVFKTSGHILHLQLVKIESEGKTAVYLADIIPTTNHISPPFITGFDLYPLETLKAKKEIIKNALEKNWLLLFYHDPAVKMGYMNMKEGQPVVEPYGLKNE